MLHPQKIVPQEIADAQELRQGLQDAGRLQRSQFLGPVGPREELARRNRGSEAGPPSGLGERGNRCVKCLMSTVAAMQLALLLGIDDFLSLAVGDEQRVERPGLPRTARAPAKYRLPRSASAFVSSYRNPDVSSDLIRSTVNWSDASLSISICTGKSGLGVRSGVLTSLARNVRGDTFDQRPVRCLGIGAACNCRSSPASRRHIFGTPRDRRPSHRPHRENVDDFVAQVFRRRVRRGGFRPAQRAARRLPAPGRMRGPAGRRWSAAASGS